MCFLPMPLLKLIVGGGAIASLLVSLALLALSIYVNFEKGDIIDKSDQDEINRIIVIMYILSILFLVLSFCGIYGSIKARTKKSKIGSCLLSVYFIGVVIFLVVFVIASILFFIAPTSLFGGTCEKGSKTELVSEMFNLNTEAEDLFCKDECPCYMNSTNTKSYLAMWLEERNHTISNDPKSSYRNYQACMGDADKQKAILFGSLQEILDCAGWCSSDTKYFKFTDINHCTSKQCMSDKVGCYDKFKDFLVSKGNILGVGGVIASTICLLNLIMIVCICYHPINRNNRKRQNFYARMMESD